MELINPLLHHQLECILYVVLKGVFEGHFSLLLTDSFYPAEFM